MLKNIVLVHRSSRSAHNVACRTGSIISHNACDGIQAGQGFFEGVTGFEALGSFNYLGDQKEAFLKKISNSAFF